MIPAEPKPCTGNTQDGTRDDIEAVVHEVGIPCRRDVDRGTDGDEGEDDEMGGRRSCLLARLHVLIDSADVLVVEERNRDCHFGAEK